MVLRLVYSQFSFLLFFGALAVALVHTRSEQNDTAAENSPLETGHCLFSPDFVDFNSSISQKVDCAFNNQSCFAFVKENAPDKLLYGCSLTDAKHLPHFCHNSNKCDDAYYNNVFGRLCCCQTSECNGDRSLINQLAPVANDTTPAPKENEHAEEVPHAWTYFLVLMVVCGLLIAAVVLLLVCALASGRKVKKIDSDMKASEKYLQQTLKRRDNELLKQNKKIVAEYTRHHVSKLWALYSGEGKQSERDSTVECSAKDDLSSVISQDSTTKPKTSKNFFSACWPSKSDKKEKDTVLANTALIPPSKTNAKKPAAPIRIQPSQKDSTLKSAHPSASNESVFSKTHTSEK